MRPGHFILLKENISPGGTFFCDASQENSSVWDTLEMRHLYARIKKEEFECKIVSL